MGQVSVQINDRSYTVACDDGEEDHLRDLARYVDKHVSDLARSIGQVGDQRLLLMASLVLADELSTMLSRVDTLEAEIETLKETRTGVATKAQNAESSVADVLERAARRIEAIAGRLEAT